MKRLALALLFLCSWKVEAQQSQPTKTKPKGPVCGNNIIEPPEQCDNGNTKSGDGCSADCQNETILYDLFGKKKAPKTPEEQTEGPGATPKALDPNYAFRLSIVTTLFLTPGLGTIYGPSMGHFYAGEANHGLLTSVLRAGLIGGQVAIAVKSAKGEIDSQTALILSGAVGLTFSGLVGYDLLDGPRAVERALAKKKILEGREAPEPPKQAASKPSPKPTSAPTSIPATNISEP